MNISKKLIYLALAGIVLTLFTSMTAIAQYGNEWPDTTTADEVAFFGGAMCIFAVVMLVIGILIAIWVYKDAEKRGSSGALWLVIVIFTGIIGLIIWLVVRPPLGGNPQQGGMGSNRNCPNCGRPIPMDAQVCPYCGKNFTQ